MKCKECNKTTKKLYYHSNKKEGKKWIPIAYYCFNCKIFNGSAKGKCKFDYTINTRMDNRFKGEICRNCQKKMIKLYAVFRQGNKQTWKPVFWYCKNCQKIIARIRVEEKIYR